MIINKIEAIKDPIRRFLRTLNISTCHNLTIGMSNCDIL